jgi:hypothetical protein
MKIDGIPFYSNKKVKHPGFDKGGTFFTDWSTIGFFAILLALLNCSRNNITNPIDPQFTTTNWDTTFTIAGNTFPDRNAYNRSVISHGNEQRFKWLYSQMVENDTLYIGAIGGSITEGCGARPGDNAYGNRVCNFLKNNFPDKCFCFINAGVGATNSRFACSRVNDDLLVKRPDLIIIEFAVNDRPSDAAAYEGLVRLCLKKIDGPVILFYTMTQSGDKSNQEIESRIGVHYNLPMISCLSALWPLLSANKIPWDSLAWDAVHPNNNGHLIYAQLLFSFIKQSLDRLSDLNYVIPSIPHFYITDFYENSAIYDTTDTVITQCEYYGWNQQIKEFGRIGFSSIDSFDTISFLSMAREVVIGYRCSQKYNADLQVIMDGNSIGNINNYFADDWGEGHMSLFTLYTSSVRSRHDLQLIKTDGDQFIIEYILYVE